MLAIVLFFGMAIVFAIPFQMLGMPSEGAVICGIIGAVCCVAWIIANENSKRNPGPAPTVVQPEPTGAVAPSVKRSLDEQMEDLRTKLNRLQEISYSLEAASPEVLPISIETYLGMFFQSFLYEVAREIRCSNEDRIAVLEQLFSLCPERYDQKVGASVREFVGLLQGNDTISEYARSMRQFPLIIMDLGLKTERKAEASEFLQLQAAAIVSAARVCDLLYPGQGLIARGNNVASRWIAQL